MDNTAKVVITAKIDGYDAPQNGYGYISSDIIQPDSRDDLRAYLVRYALWAVCGIGAEPQKPPCLRDVVA